MISIIIIILFYFIIVYLLSSLFSLSLCGINLISTNSECGFINFITSFIKYRLNYWLIILNFLLFELELLISFLFIFSLSSIYSLIAILLLFLLLLLDLYY